MIRASVIKIIAVTGGIDNLTEIRRFRHAMGGNVQCTGWKWAEKKIRFNFLLPRGENVA